MPKHRRSSHPAPVRLSSAAGAELRAAQAHIQRGELPQARRMLEQLDARRPKSMDVLVHLAEVCRQMQDRVGYLDAVQQIAAIQPNNPTFILALGSAYVRNGRVSLALGEYERFLKRWPAHPEAANVELERVRLQGILSQMEEVFDLQGPRLREAAELFDRMQVLVERGRYAEAIPLGEQIIAMQPRYAPVWNNIASAQWALGRAEEALTTAQHVLEIEPDNVHALGSLTRFYFLLGNLESAAEYAERLQRSAAPAADRETKLAEVFSLLEDDVRIIEAFQQADLPGNSPEPLNPFLCHLAAVSYAHLGDRESARRLWKQALSQAPHLAIVHDNLADFELPTGQRSGAWPFAIQNLLLPQVFHDLVQASSRAASRKGDADALATEIRAFLRRHPEVETLLPFLFARGGPQGQEFALMIARCSLSPAAHEALADFARGQSGSDSRRFQALNAARELGVLQGTHFRMWNKGAWTEISPISFQISSEAAVVHSEEVTPLLQEALQALQTRDGKTAEALYERALALHPDQPDILNNLAIARDMQGRHAEARSMIEDIFARFPDYLFGKISIARIKMQEGRQEEARALLIPLMQREKLHYAEFAALAAIHVEISLNESALDSARAWLDMWKQVNPDDPNLAILQREAAQHAQPRRQPATVGAAQLASVPPAGQRRNLFARKKLG